MKKNLLFVALLLTASFITMQAGLPYSQGGPVIHSYSAAQDALLTQAMADLLQAFVNANLLATSDNISVTSQLLESVMDSLNMNGVVSGNSIMIPTVSALVIQ